MSKKRSRKLSRQEKIDAYIGEISMNPEYYFSNNDYNDEDIYKKACELANESDMYASEED